MKPTLYLFLVLSTAITAVVAAIDLEEPLERDEIIDAVNAAGTTWKAGRNFDPSLKKSYLKSLINLKQRPRVKPPPRYVADEAALELEKLPTTFDAREEWSECMAMSQIMDQGPCFSSYVIVPTMVFQDRLCIATKGAFNTYLSVQQTLTCCEYCVDDYGCWGGYDDYVWDYLLNSGTCTGGPYLSKVGCQPYTIPGCNHDFESLTSSGDTLKNCSSYGDGDGIIDTPRCKSTCYNKKYTNNTFDNDIHTMNSTFTLDPSVKLIQKELYNNGPLEAFFWVYEDFLSYKSGVYQYTTGDLYGSQVVRVLGWGVEDGTKYWLAANSWNENWGDQGFFKIKRGDNECEFEDTVMGGMVNADGFF